MARRREFLRQALALGVWYGAVGRSFAQASSPEVLGQGDFRYRVVTGWGVLNEQTPVNDCHGLARTADGQIVLHITPKDGTPQVVTVPVSRGTGENAVARTIRDALRAQLGTKAFTVETDDGEDVLVKRRGKTPDFAMKIAENTVKGVRLNLDKE